MTNNKGWNARLKQYPFIAGWVLPPLRQYAALKAFLTDLGLAR